MLNKSLCFIDIETNSQSLEFDIQKQEIIQVGIYNPSTKEKFQKNIKIESSLSEFTKRLTGITDAEIASGDQIQVVLRNAIEFIGDPKEVILVGHNISGFDLPILSRYNPAFSKYQYLDTLQLFLLLFPGLKSYSIQDLYEFFLREGYKETHQALQDCIDEAELFFSVINIDYISAYYKDHNKNVQFLKHVIQKCIDNGPIVLQNYMQTFIMDLFKDVTCDEIIKGKQKLVEMYFKKRKGDNTKENDKGTEDELPPIVQISTKEIDDSYQGFLTKIGKEHRDAQRAMMQNIKDVFNGDNKNLFIEAGTGIGKTYGYILPSMEFVKKNPDYKVFFATYTKVLQEQLWAKDIPLMKESYPNVQVELLKASSEAISLQNVPFNKGLEQWDVILRNWLYWENFYMSDMSYIIIKNLGEGRSGKYMYNVFVNRKYRLDEKYGFKGKFKDQIEKGQIFVINHAFMVTNLNDYFKDSFTGLNLPKNKPTISPSRAFFVIDEGHNLEGVIRDDFTIDFTKNMVENILGYFMKSSFYTIADVIKNKTKYLSDEDECMLDQNDQKIIKDILSSIDAVLSDKTTLDLHKKFKTCVESFDSTGLYNIIINDIQSLRNKGYDTNRVEYDKHTFDEYYMNSAFIDFFEYAYQYFTDLYEKIRKECEFMQSVQKHGIIDIFYNFARYFNIGKVSLTQDTSEYFFNFIAEFKENSLEMINMGFFMVPVSLFKGTSFLRRAAGNVVLSATLFDANERNKNSYVLEEIFGGEYRNAKSLRYSSPFNYQTQRKIYVCKEGLNQETKMDTLHKFIEKFKGKTLVLTTTTAEKIKIAIDCKKQYEKSGIMVLMHETGSMSSRMNQNNVNQLRKNPNTILIGSKSYMEGVDIQGDHLSLVALAKLPFLPPRPFISFKEEQYKMRGNGFVYKFLSSINFRQAIGRLIRSQTDTGEILILDDRILEKSGSFFREYIKDENLIEI